VIKPPRWSDFDAVDEFVRHRNDKRDRDEAIEDALRADELPGISRQEFARGIEDEAVRVARLGNFRALADLLRWGIRLGPEAVSLVADKLTGKNKRGMGRPRKTLDQRLLDTCLPEAEAEYHDVKSFLEEHYDVKAKDIRDRALILAAKEYGITDDKLRNYIDRLEGDRRRLSPRPDKKVHS
jgi:hypothetical protein